jgi:hypothetical protein
MDVSEIVAEFGAYYIDQGQNMARLVKILNFALETEKMFTPMMTDDTVYRGAQSTLGRIVQPFQQAWTPIASGLTFTPIQIQLYNQKVDLDETPHTLEATWLGFLSSKELDPITWPFVRWYLEVWLIPKIQEDIEINEIYAGAYVAPANGVAGDAGTSMDGVKKIINTNINSGRISAIADIGAIPVGDDEDVYDYLEMFADRIGKKYWAIPMMIGCGMDVARSALRGKSLKYNRNTVGIGIDNKVEYTNLSIVGLPSHNGAAKIWCTPKANAAFFRKKSANMKQFKIESIKRTLSLYTDFWNGIGFHIPEIVFTNAADLV